MIAEYGSWLYGKAAYASLVMSGWLDKTRIKILSGAITPVGTILKSMARALSGSVSTAASVVRSTTKSFLSFLSPRGTILRLKRRILMFDRNLVLNGWIGRYVRRIEFAKIKTIWRDSIEFILRIRA
jgi:hypothetical protein